MAGWLDRLRARDKGPGLLIVDDDDDLRGFVRTLLASEDYGPVYEAAGGEAAIEISFKHHPHLVVLDYEMPVMNGEAVAKSLRLLTPGIRIVLLTAVLKGAPEWADIFLEKSEIERLPDVVEDQRMRLLNA